MFFTPYSFFNVNVSDEFVLRSLYLIRTGDPVGAEAFRIRVQESRIRRDDEPPPRYVERKELPALLGLAYDRVYPVLNAEPPLNVHFVSERVLREIARHYEVTPGLIDALLQQRNAGELTEKDVRTLLDGQSPLFGRYLGVRSWFWEITVTGQEHRLRWVVARLPSRDATEFTYQIVERSVQP